MINPTAALGRATACGEQVAALLSAIQIVVLLLESKLHAHTVQSTAKAPGVLRSLVEDVRELYAVSLQLGNLVNRAVDSGRAHLALLPTGGSHRCDLAPELAVVVPAARIMQDTFDAAEATINEIRKHAQRDVDLLLETALRQDAGPALSASVSQLIARFRTGPATG
ncbi:hypothetical protein [Ottowia sp.]|uniref:hypothetical protein n=1 Tax=Ottowia sp. TaxID=1898956 RepID=UPI0025D3BAB5|nr:hypothetical protein [Ottowia sp.]MBK6616170.1 hypothetical protein [Ottowia sp.]